MEAIRTPAVARVALLMVEATRANGLLGTATAYHLASGGGAWRMALALDCSTALKVPATDAAVLAAACELMHQASIVHDDAQDGAARRRNRPSVAARFGLPVAVCVGDHLLVSAFGVLAARPGTSALIPLFAARISAMAAGQADEFAPTLWTAMTLDHYRSLVRGKAGAAVALPIEGAARLAGLPRMDVEAAGGMGHALGVFYQVSDDAADLVADLARGALNGVVAHALQASSPLERAELLALLARARREGLPVPEAEAEASRLGPHASRAAEWARALLDVAAEGLGAHRLAPVLSAATAALAFRLDAAASARRHAA